MTSISNLLPEVAIQRFCFGRTQQSGHVQVRHGRRQSWSCSDHGVRDRAAGGLRWLRAEVHALAQAPGALHSASSG